MSYRYDVVIALTEEAKNKIPEHLQEELDSFQQVVDTPDRAVYILKYGKVDLPVWEEWFDTLDEMSFAAIFIGESVHDYDCAREFGDPHALDVSYDLVVAFSY